MQDKYLIFMERQNIQQRSCHNVEQVTPYLKLKVWQKMLKTMCYRITNPTVIAYMYIARL